MSLYLLKEAGALLASGATAGAFAGRDASPPYMPTLPWRQNIRNAPPQLATPMLATRVPPGTPRPPSPYSARMRVGEVWGLTPDYQDAAGLDSAGDAPVSQAPMPPPGTGSNAGPSSSAPMLTFNAQIPTATTSTQGQPDQPQAGPTPAPPYQPPPAIPPAVAITPTPQTVYIPPPVTAPPPSFDTGPAPTTGGGGGGGGSTNTGLLIAGGAVLALLYFGRKKKRGRR